MRIRPAHLTLNLLKALEAMKGGVLIVRMAKVEPEAKAAPKAVATKVVGKIAPKAVATSKRKAA